MAKDSTSIQTEQPKKMLAMLSFLTSIFLGISFAYLFLWKEPGISHLIYYIFSIIVIVGGVLIVDPKSASKRIGITSILLFVGLIISSLFLYRLKPSVVWISFITLPWVYSSIFVSVFNKDLFKGLGILSFISLPIVLFASWFGDIVGFVSNLKFSRIKDNRVRSIIKRVSVGVVISIPFLFLFMLLFSSADAVFGEYISNFFVKIFGSWFKDFTSFISLVTKVGIAGLVSIYFMVFNFSLWNQDSKLANYIEKHMSKGVFRMKQSWDPLTSSVFLGMLNLLFLSFVAVQFVYLFAGNKNILGEDANYTYAEYARRGFAELVFVALLVYLIIYLLSFKVQIRSTIQKVIFRANYVLMVLLTLIITFSSQMRLLLIEDTYGFTNIRFVGHYTTVVIAVLFLMLLISALVRNSTKFISISTFVVIFGALTVYAMFPSDYYVAKMNYNRFIEDDRIDMPYMFNLSDEAVPVLVDLYESDETGSVMKAVILVDLSVRKDRMDDQRNHWVSYNITHSLNKAVLDDLLGSHKDPYTDAEETFNQFIDEYSELLVEGDYETAFDEYWSATSEKTDWDTLEKISINKYLFAEGNTYANQAVESSIGSYSESEFNSSYSYWDGVTVYAKVFYQGVDEYGYAERYCKNDMLNVKLENGEWKILSSSLFPLGEFNGGGDGFRFDTDFDHLSSDYLMECY